MSLTVTDIFAGAGGSSTGMIAVPGLQVRMAANHSKLAVRVHNANHPGHQSLITPGDLEAAYAQVDDCLFRMLEPHEVAAGMAFPGDYKWEGNRRQRVKLMGNAVTPPAARDLMATVVESLDGAA